MGTISITKDYLDGSILYEADLDNIVDAVETFLNTPNLGTNNIQDDGITASSKFSDSSVITALIPNSAITTVKIADANITTDLILNSAVTTDKIAAANITTAKIADNTVTSTSINTNAVTNIKQGSSNYALSSGTASTGFTSYGTYTSYTLISGLQATITTTGRPVEIRIVPTIDSYTTSQKNFYQFLANNYGVGNTYLKVVRDATDVIEIKDSNTPYNLGSVNTRLGKIHSSFGPFIDTPSAGTYVYSIYTKVDSSGAGGYTVYQGFTLFVREL